MKNLKNKIALVALFAGIAFSCGDKLNINPAQNIDASQALATSKDVQGALIGAYNFLGGGSSGDLYYGGIQVYADLLADTSDFSFFGTFQGLQQINNKAIPVNNNFVANVWLEGYSAINLTNEVLNALNVVNPALQDQVEGEAKFIRACVYFELVKLFAKTYTDDKTSPGVPIVLLPTHSLSDAENKPARNTVAEVYAQIISDLSDAEAKLANPDNVSYYFATPGAAAAILSRVYLMQHDYANALAAANRVINSGYYSLTNTYAEEFPYLGTGVRIYNTSEDIFAVQVSEQSGVNNLNTYYASSDKGGRGDIEADSAFLATYDPADQRARMYVHDDVTTFDGKDSVYQNGDWGVTYYCSKFNNQYGNVKIVRLAEMYLTRAECNYQLNSAVGDTPLNDVNLIRARAGLTGLGSISSVNDILTERHFELAAEGQWLWDYKRTGANVGALPYNDPTLIFPIPQREIQVNKNLVQNAGYN